jgi:transcriptional regulator with PAS, ATPase and Fis domain
MPLATQIKLLRVLESKEIFRIGSNTPIRVCARIITATNRDLPDLISKGMFREDLYYRINVLPIHLPPLRDRKEDIPLLVQAFLLGIRSSNQKRITGISPDVMDTFMRYPWPGNVRELKSTIEYAFVLCEAGMIEPQHLPEQLQLAMRPDAALPAAGSSPALSTDTDTEEKMQLINALRQAGGNQTQAAKILGVHRMTVWNRMRKYSISFKKGL